MYCLTLTSLDAIGIPKFANGAVANVALIHSREDWRVEVRLALRDTFPEALVTHLQREAPGIVVTRRTGRFEDQPYDVIHAANPKQLLQALIAFSDYQDTVMLQESLKQAAFLNEQNGCYIESDQLREKLGALSKISLTPAVIARMVKGPYENGRF